MDNKRVFIVVGDDLFQQQKLKEIFAEYKVNRDNIDFFEPQNQDWQTISLFLKTYSLFGTPKFFVVLNSTVFSQKEEPEALLAKSEELFNENNFAKAHEYLIEALVSSEISDEEYTELLRDLKQIKNLFESTSVNTDFLEQLLKKYPLPDVLPKKSEIDFKSMIQSIPEGHYLVITTEKADKRTKNFKIFEKESVIFEKSDKKLTDKEKALLNDRLLSQFLKEEKKEISKETLLYLKERTAETGSPEAALNKLAILTFGKKEITRDDIDATFDDEYVPDGLKLADFLRKEELLPLFKIINNPKSTKSDFIKLSGLIKSLIKTAIKLKEITKEEVYNDFRDFENRCYRNHADLRKQHPYYLFQCYLTFKNYSLQKLSSSYTRLFEIEKAMKTTQKNPIDLFSDFFRFLLANPRN